MASQIFVILLTFSFFTIINCYPSADNSTSNGTFYYFAYGSNLLAKRLHIKNPTAVFFSPAKLAKHRLDFNIYASFWDGAVATIVEDDENDVWGSLWTIDINQKKYLDEVNAPVNEHPPVNEQNQENPDWYFAKNVTVTTPDGTQVPARTYQEYNNPSKLKKGEDLPPERRPSSTYLQAIALGAIESHLPTEYIAFLFSFPTNGKIAPKTVRAHLPYPF